MTCDIHQPALKLSGRLRPARCQLGENPGVKLNFSSSRPVSKIFFSSVFEHLEQQLDECEAAAVQTAPLRLPVQFECTGRLRQQPHGVSVEPGAE